jgi:hypothetical protein
MQKSITRILDSYTKSNSINGFLAKIFIIFTRYDCFCTDNSENDSIILFIGFEKVQRSDHLDQLSLIFNALNLNTRCTSIIGFKRRFTLSYLWLFMKLRSVNKLALRQMENALNGIDLQQYKKCLVQCDIVPIQAFMVRVCNGIGVDTFSLQHGFYPHPSSSPQWLTEYECSESRNMFAWDEKTISFFKSVNNQKNYIKAGPFAAKEKMILPHPSERERIIVLLPSKNDAKHLEYIIGLGQIYVKLGIEVIYVSHPNYNWFNRICFGKKNGIKIRSQNFKEFLKEKDICFVLNSSVWVELELSGLKVIILDTMFTIGKMLKEDICELKKHVNVYNRKPFMMGGKAVSTIVQVMLNG